MPLLNSVISWFIRKRIHQIELFMKYPHEVQEEWFEKLINESRDTEWGKKYDYRSIQTEADFRNRVPVSEYNDLKPYIDRLRKGEQNILWPSDIKWFAKSSGTTGDKSKFIPVTEDALEECHFKGGKDLLSIYCNNNPNTRIFSGKWLGLGGSFNLDDAQADTYHGDVSAIIMENLPFWIQLIRTPDLSVALMDEWESKIERIARITAEEDVTNITGVPSWMMVLLNRILEIKGISNVSEIWPNLELFVHGGVSFIPYRDQYKRICPPGMNYLETYNASEGFFGIQDRLTDDDMLLMLDYGIYYEFMPVSEIGNPHPKTLGLDQVETGVHYAMIISTNAGLWRYLIGDTVTFSSIDPFRIRITGRTKSFINAFGEELVIDNADKALAIACEKSHVQIRDYTAAPIYLDENKHAAHEWLVEFDTPPESIEYFTEILDNALKSLNSDYEAKRYHNMVLKPPIVHALQPGTFYNWMKEKGKLGGQNKVPRLSNDRKYVDDILKSFSPAN
ncbi:MAG: GH3 auxin-responsive promoter family protein [Bacteroidales bacterium]|nr:GH3 auxin-responsive promoter family protein [Bacteroidales bacterium]